MSERLDQQKWLKEFAFRVWNLAQHKKPIVVRENGNIIFEFDIGKLLNIGEGKTTIELGQPGLKTKGNLVGMSGCYYHPNIFWGGTVENVVSSWEWLMKRMSVDAEGFQTVVEMEAILEFLITGWEEGLLFHLLSLAVDLHELDSIGVDVTPKISELGIQARAHLRKFEKLKDKVQSLFRITALRSYMANLSSECRLARLAKEYGYKVKLGKHPDLTINGKSIEVKRVRAKFFINKLRHRVPLANLSNPIKRGLKQKADIIAIQVLNLEKRNVNGFKTVWIGSDIFRNILKTALAFKNKGRCVLLFCGTNRGYFGRIILLK